MGYFRKARLHHHRRAKGSAAIELALMMPILVIFLMLPIFFAKVFWHYTIAQKAAKDAARYLSTISRQELKSATLAPDAAAIATQIATTELAEMDPGRGPPRIQVFCGDVSCAGLGSRPIPSTVRVRVEVDMYDTIFGTIDTGRYGIPLTADVQMTYVGL